MATSDGTNPNPYQPPLNEDGTIAWDKVTTVTPQTTASGVPNWPAVDGWVAVSAPPFPEEWRKTIDTVEQTINTVDAVLQGVIVLIQAEIVLAAAKLNATRATLLAAAAALDAVVNSLQNGLGVQAIFLPIRRKVYAPWFAEVAARTGLSTPEGADTALQRRFVQLELEAVAAGSGQAIVDAIRNSATADSGKLGLSRTFLESLVDPGDPNRPRLQSTDYVAGFVVAAGAADYIDLIEPLFALQALFARSAPGLQLVPTDIPTPQDLVAIPLKGGVRLEWRSSSSPIPAPTISEDAAYKPRRVTVLRSADTKLLLCRTFEDIRFNNVAIDRLGEVPAYVQEYYDESDLVKASDDPIPVYYTVVYDLDIISTKDKSAAPKVKTIPSPLSNVAKAVNSARRPANKQGSGTPPDWFKLSLPDAVPPLYDALEFVKEQSNNFKRQVRNGSDALEDFVKEVQRKLEGYKAKIAQVKAAIDAYIALVKALSNSGAGIHYFAGSGGQGYLVKEVTGSFEKLPFATKDLAVGAVVFVSAPSAEAVEPTLQLLKSLFSASSQSAGVEAAGISLQAQIDALKSLLSDEEKKKIEPENPGTNRSPLQGCSDHDLTPASLGDDLKQEP